MIFILVSLIFYPGLALTVARGDIITRTYVRSIASSTVPLHVRTPAHMRINIVRAEVVTFTCNQESV